MVFQGYASAGNNVVFLGGFGSLDIINEIFSWELTPVTYQVLNLVDPTPEDSIENLSPKPGI